MALRQVAGPGRTGRTGRSLGHWPGCRQPRCGAVGWSRRERCWPGTNVYSPVGGPTRADLPPVGRPGDPRPRVADRGGESRAGIPPGARQADALGQEVAFGDVQDDLAPSPGSCCSGGSARPTQTLPPAVRRAAVGRHDSCWSVRSPRRQRLQQQQPTALAAARLGRRHGCRVVCTSSRRTGGRSSDSWRGHRAACGLSPRAALALAEGFGQFVTAHFRSTRQVSPTWPWYVCTPTAA